jgi:hypothetical protein
VGGITLEFKDAAQALTAGTGCVAGPPVSCAASDQEIRFGSGDDRFRAFSLEPITISGGGGDGGNDTVDCGTGADIVAYDAGDTISRHCEIRSRGSLGSILQVEDARDDAAAFVAAMPAIPGF